MALNTIKIGLVGMGTVGSGVAKLLLEQADAIEARTGLRLELASVVDKDLEGAAKRIKLPAGLLTDDINRIIKDKDIQIGVELIGGTTAAKKVQLQMLAAGKDVVTANKALLAEHGSELFKAAHENKRCIAFEASCAGGIPIISAVRTGLTANRIQAIYGILNGTCNYILSKMTAENEDFPAALAQAQQRGYAEADPTLDINGVDSAHKLAILAAISFGYEISMDDIYVEGIKGISINDIRYGGEMGYVIKLLAIGERSSKGKISLRVHPSFIAKDNALARVDGPFNAISIFGHAVGQTFYYGRGAGMMPTASAVVADIIDVAMGNSQTTFNHTQIEPHQKALAFIDKIDNLVSRFYVRVMAKDKPGVFARLGKILGDHQISISGVLQHEGSGPANTVPVVITTHPTVQKNMFAALKDISKSDVINGKPVCIRIVDIREDKD
jgi:homoserine dehydrogenase